MISELPFTELFVRQIWQLTVVLVGVGVFVRLCCRRRPYLAYALWLVVLVKAITPPLWVSNLSVFRSPEASELGWSLVVPQEKPLVEASDKASVSEDSPDFSSATQKQVPVPPQKPNGPSVASVVWLIGAVVLSSVSAGLVWLRGRRMRHKEVVAVPELVEAVSQISEQLGLRRPARLLVTADGFGPALIGFWRPTIVLPECVLANKTLQDWKPTLTHELIHLRRGDHERSLAYGTGAVFVVQACKERPLDACAVQRIGQGATNVLGGTRF